ncbi:MAG: DUF5685 family protein [Roseburia sp.]|nr:DUF5685 family protein [Roseburia sp.]
MFGYININRNQLTEESRKAYQAYYCGLCQQLRGSCGSKGQLLLNYDMTFLVVLLTGLYELESKQVDFTCPMHPTKKQTAWINEATDYAADMNILLGYHNLQDDWKDDKSYTKKALAKMLEKDYGRVREKYERQAKAVETYMQKLQAAEEDREQNLDVTAGLTGEMMGEIFDWKKDEWSEELHCLSFYMGKFIYLMDAYEDMEKDKKRKQYNPLRLMADQCQGDFETFCKLMLTSMMSECARSFERLPILTHADILRNVLYSGVWSKYEYLQLKKKKQQEKKEKRGK